MFSIHSFWLHFIFHPPSSKQVSNECYRPSKRNYNLIHDSVLTHTLAFEMLAWASPTYIHDIPAVHCSCGTDSRILSRPPPTYPPQTPPHDQSRSCMTIIYVDRKSCDHRMISCFMRIYIYIYMCDHRCYLIRSSYPQLQRHAIRSRNKHTHKHRQTEKQTDQHTDRQNSQHRQTSKQTRPTDKRLTDSPQNQLTDCQADRQDKPMQARGDHEEVERRVHLLVPATDDRQTDRPTDENQTNIVEHGKTQNKNNKLKNLGNQTKLTERPHPSRPKFPLVWPVPIQNPYRPFLGIIDPYRPSIPPTFLSNINTHFFSRYSQSPYKTYTGETLHPACDSPRVSRRVSDPSLFHFFNFYRTYTQFSNNFFSLTLRGTQNVLNTK